MFFDEVPAFDEILRAVGDFEKPFNQLSPTGEFKTNLVKKCQQKCQHNRFERVKSCSEAVAELNLTVNASVLVSAGQRCPSVVRPR